MIIDSGIVTGSLQVSGSFNVQGIANLDGGLTVIGGITGSISGSSATAVSASHAETSSYAISAQNADASFLATSASYASNATTSDTASFAPNYLPLGGGTLTGSLEINNSNLVISNGNLTVNGTASITYLVTTYESASVIFSSGSNVFGDALGDTHQFTGSVTVTGSLSVNDSSVITSAATSSMSVLQAQSASLAGQANNAATASYVTLAQTASYVASAISASRASSAQNADNAATASIAINALTVSYVPIALTASYVQNAISASYSPYALTSSYAIVSATASSAEDFTVRGLASIGGEVLTGTYQFYVTTSINDGAVGIDSSGEINAMYFLKGGLRKFEISTAGDGTPITQLLPYTSSGIFRIGNPSNGSSDLIFLSEPVNGNVLLGPGILTGSTSLSGSQPTDRVQFTGDTFVSGTVTVLNNLAVQGNVSSVGGFTGSLNGTADTAINAPYYVLTASYNADSASFSTRVTNNEYTGSTLTAASASFSTRVTNLESFSSSLDATFATDAQLNTATASLQAGVTASINTATASLQAGVTASINTATASLQAGVTSSINTATASLSSSLAVSIAQNTATGSSLTTASGSFSTRVTNLETTASILTTASASFAAVSSSYSATSGSLSTRTTNLEATASTLTTASASFAVVSGSYSTTSGSYSATSGSLSTRTTNLEATASTLTTASGSLSTRTTNLEATASTLTIASASFAAASGSLSTRTTNLESTASILTTASASIATQLNTINGVTGSYATTGSNIFTGIQYVSNTTDATSFVSDAAIYTDGGLRVTKNAYVSGTIYVNNLTVFGTSSVQYTTSSQANFGTNIITVNTATPSIRFGGYSVYDSGSLGTGLSGSLLWDSQNDVWIYTTPSGSPDGYNSARLISGPQNTGSLGQEQGLTTGKITVAVGDDHIGDSIMNQTGNFVYLTGSLSATTLTGSLNGSNLIVGSVANDRLQNNAITIAGTSTSLGGSITAATILTSTGVFSGSTQIPNTSITNTQLVNSSVTVIAGTGLSGGGSVPLGGSVTISNAGVTSFNTRTGTVTLAATDISGLGAGIFSGSTQIPAASITNAQLANSTISGIALGSNLATLTIGTGLSGTSYNGSTGVTIANTGVTSFNTRTGGVTLAATDISGLGAGIFSGSAQIPNTSITNAQLVNSSVTVTAGSGLSGGGAVSLGGTVTISNAGVTSNVAGSGISVSGATGAVTITNTGVTSAVAGTGVSVSGATGAVTISIGQSVATSATPSFDQVFATNNGNGTNFKVGDDAWIGDVNAANTIRIKGQQDATAGYITFGNQTTALGLTNSTTLTWGAAFTATGDVTAFSDARVKENVETITGALDKVLRLRGVTYNRTDLEDKSQKIGFIAQEVQEVVPQVVLEENDRLSVAYGNLGGLFVEAFKEQQAEIEKNKAEILELRELINRLLNK